MELSPCSRAASFVVTQNISNILRNPKIHYRVQKSPSLVPVLSHIDAVHTISFYFSKINFNIIHPATSWP
jgi:hypothetical protein